MSEQKSVDIRMWHGSREIPKKMRSIEISYLAVLLILAEAGFFYLFLRSERVRASADVVCCGLLGAFVHLLMLQFGNIRSEEWEVLSASILVLSFAFMGWSMNREQGDDTQNMRSLVNLSNVRDEITGSGNSSHDERLITLGSMSARFVHEVNQPLCTAILRIQEMKRARHNGDDVSIDKCIASIEIQLEHVVQITHAVRRFSSPDTEAQTGFVEVRDVFQLVHDLSDVWTSGNAIEFKWPAEFPPIVVSGGCTLHAQVLMNLIRNAVDAVCNLPKQARRWIEVEISLRGGSVEIAVSNAGSAVGKKTQSNLFRPFFSTKRMGQGLGLGLSICRELVESVGGEIWYDENSPHPRFVARYSFLPSVKEQLNDVTSVIGYQDYKEVA